MPKRSLDQSGALAELNIVMRGVSKEIYTPLKAAMLTSGVDKAMATRAAAAISRLPGGQLPEHIQLATEGQRKARVPRRQRMPPPHAAAPPPSSQEPPRRPPARSHSNC